MRYRTLSPTGDYVFGRGSTEFLVDSSAAVAQAIRTRLLLGTGEWYLDVAEGTPYSTQILGENRQTYDQAIRARILGTPGVISIENYSSTLDGDRHLTVNCLVNTQFGQTFLTQVL